LPFFPTQYNTARTGVKGPLVTLSCSAGPPLPLPRKGPPGHLLPKAPGSGDAARARLEKART